MSRDSNERLYMSPFDALYGLELLDTTPDHLTARVPVRESLTQPFGYVHGGVIASVCESLASLGTGLVVFSQGSVPLGMANSTMFIRPIRSGFVHGSARPRHRGRSTWIWDVEITDDAGALCAMGRVTIAVREPRA